MWSMTQDGFVSIVQKNGGLEVRSRDRKSLERFCELARVKPSRIVAEGGTDYQFRVRRVAKKDVKRYLCGTVDGINYSNFKNRANLTRGAVYASCLGACWNAMWGLVIPKPYVASTASRSSYWGDPEPDLTVDYDINELMNMSPEDREVALTDLEFDARMGDHDAADLLLELEQHDFMAKRIQDMTDDEFAEYEASFE